MTHRITRRHALKAGISVALIPILTACGDETELSSSGTKLVEKGARFPQGVASADPRPDCVVLWTRAIPLESGENTHPVTVQVSKDESFELGVLEERVDAAASDDYTVRVIISGLAPGTVYYYRFITKDNVVSRIGRTWTAPPEDADVAATVATFSCQHHDHGFFKAYRHLINEERRDPSRRVDLILHLGDFIYEFKNDPWSVPLSYADGRVRKPVEFPSGGTKMGGFGADAATTLDDYRALYKTYLLDPDLQEARALYPFVVVWDDHERLNDGWQTASSAGPAQRQCLAGTKAWAEYIPALLSDDDCAGETPSPAYDFQSPAREIEDAPFTEFDENYLNQEPNNLAVINSIRIYREIKWGRHFQLVLTDNRSYRSPSAAVDELYAEANQTVKTVVDPYPISVIEVLAEGRTFNDGNPPESVLFNGQGVPNPRVDKPPTTILGYDQKRWFKTTLLESKATWKVWGTAGPLMPMRFDFSNLRDELGDGILWPDSWDGAPNERRELTGFIRENRISNVVSLAGDRHSQFAGYVLSEPADDASPAVAVEFACTGASAISRTGVLSFQVRHDSELSKITAVRTPDGTLPTLNIALRYGVQAALKAADGLEGLANSDFEDDSPNPHLHYADTDTYGYLATRFTQESADAQFVCIERPIRDEPPKEVRRVRWSVKAWTGGDSPVLNLEEVVGNPVFDISLGAQPVSSTRQS